MSKSKSKRKNVPTPLSSKDITLEYLLDTIVAEYFQVTLVPTGTVQGELKSLSNADYDESITLKPLCQFESGCPRNFHDFSSSAKRFNIASKKIFSMVCKISTPLQLFYIISCIRSPFGSKVEDAWYIGTFLYSTWKKYTFI